MKDQADTIDITIRRVLLKEIEATCITRVKYEKIPHEYSTKHLLIVSNKFFILASTYVILSL